MSAQEDVEITHVLDLPQLYRRPSRESLVQTLNALAIQPSTFNNELRPHDRGSKKIFSGSGLPGYLTSIISSSLSWIDNEAAKESIWNLASTRLSERSGRAALPSVSRTFTIPSSFPSSSSSADLKPDIQITLHEPSLTADNLGHKTWSAAYLLAKRLHQLRPHLPALCSFTSSSKVPNPPSPQPRVLELGAGTGLLGIAATALWSADVTLSDLEAIVPNLKVNIATNTPTVIDPHGGKASAACLDWSTVGNNDVERIAKGDDDDDDDDNDNAEVKGPFQIILAADPLYSPLHPAWLVNTIAHYLDRSNNTRESVSESARFIVELPLREAYAPEITSFKTMMESKGLKLMMQGEEVGFDDWGVKGGEEDQEQEVRCWWGIWGWKGDRAAERTEEKG